MSTISRELADPAAEVAPEVAPEVLDLDAFPGGVKAAIEAILMVVDEPVTEVALATALEVHLCP